MAPIAPTARPGRKRAVTALVGMLLIVGVVATASPWWLPSAAERLLQSEWLRAQLNARPDERRITWRHATVIGWGDAPNATASSSRRAVWGARWVDVEVTGFRLRRQDAYRQWVVYVDQATLRVDLRALQARRLIVRRARLRGVRFALRPRLPAWPMGAVLAAATTYPAIPQVASVLRPTAPVMTNRPSRWVVSLNDVQIEALRELWIGPWRASLRGAVHGGVTLASGKITLSATRLQVEDAALWHGATAWLHGARGTLQTREIGPLTGTRLPRHLDATVQVTGDFHMAALLTSVLAKRLRGVSPTLSVHASWARLTATVGLSGGDLKPASTLQLGVPGAVVRAVVRGAPITARGPMQLTLRGTPTAIAVSARMAPATLRSPVLVALAGPTAGVRTSALTLTGHTLKPHLLGAAQEPDVAVAKTPLGPWRLRWIETEPAPLAPLLRGLHTTGASVRAGLWRVAGELLFTPAVKAVTRLSGATSPRLTIQGEVQARVQGLVATLAGQRLSGAVAATVPFRFSTQGIDIADARIRLSHGRLRPAGHGSRPWSGELTLRSGHVRFTADTNQRLTPTLRARVAAEFSDAGPLIDVVRRRAGVPDFVLKRIDTGKLRVNAKLRLSPNRLSLRRVRATSAHVQTRGGLLIRGGALRGGLLLQILRLRLGLELRGEGVVTHVLQAERWFAGSGW